MIWIVFIGIYLLSVFLTWLFFHQAYSKNGIWNNLYPDEEDLIFTFCPAVNTVVGLVGWILYYPIESNKSSLTKFFKIKR